MPTGSTPKKGSVQSPSDVSPNGSTGLGTDKGFSVPTSQPKAKGSIVSPTEVSPSSKNGLGTDHGSK